MSINLLLAAGRTVKNLLVLQTLLTVLLIQSPQISAAEDSTLYARKLSEAFEQAADKITPSVVNISSSKKAKPTKKFHDQNSPIPPHLRQFFGDDFFDRFGIPDDSEGNLQQGLGTGVIVDSKGFILTNNHVIGDADEVEVRLRDGRKFKAEIVDKDERSDLAVVKIKASGLAAATLGNSDAMRIGEWVVAAGNPFGLDNTITAGIISAKGRSILGGGQYEDFIQTDAAINPGNSGGPLVNLNGEVIGINTAIFSRNGGYMGIGFAIPVNMARNVMNSLIQDGKVVRGWLGVGIQNITEDLAASFKYEGTSGALVGHIDPEGPARKSGLKQGDIITAISGEPVKDINQLRNKIASIRPGTKVQLSIVRDGKTDQVEVKVGELPNQGAEKASSEDSDDEESVDSTLGIAVIDLTPQLAKRLDTKRTSGAVISQVRPSGLAGKSGLQPMDIVVSVNGNDVNDASGFRAAIKSADLDKGARVVVENQGMERFVFLKKD